MRRKVSTGLVASGCSAAGVSSAGNDSEPGLKRKMEELV